MIFVFSKPVFDLFSPLKTKILYLNIYATKYFVISSLRNATGDKLPLSLGWRIGSGKGWMGNSAGSLVGGIPFGPRIFPGKKSHPFPFESWGALADG